MQLFGLLPVTGFLHKNSSRLRFNIYSPLSIFSLFLQMIYILELILLFRFMSKIGFKFHMIGKVSVVVFNLLKSFFLMFRSSNIYFCVYFKWCLFLLFGNKMEKNHDVLGRAWEAFSSTSICKENKNKLCQENHYIVCCHHYVVFMWDIELKCDVNYCD